MKNPTFLALFFLFISSCCTKKYCDEDIFPQIVVEYRAIDNNSITNKAIYILDKETSVAIDSVKYNYFDNQFTINKWLMDDVFGDKREFNQYCFVLKINSQCDTIKEINYDRTSEQITCNSCFPFGDGSATVTNHENLSFIINQKLYEDVDSVSISK